MFRHLKELIALIKGHNALCKHCNGYGNCTLPFCYPSLNTMHDCPFCDGTGFANQIGLKPKEEKTNGE